MFRIVLVLGVVATPLAAQSADTAGRDTTARAAAGSYSEVQAALGEKAYKSYCASCHNTAFHTGEGFRFSWFGRSVYDLFKVLKTTMPEDNVGGLSDDDYTRVIAYILKLNGFAAGTDSLKADSTGMRRIRIGTAQHADSGKHERR
jgi:mono/diheme cytochrome c family protein